jgi:hypothetical protein
MTNDSVSKQEDVLWAALGNIKKTYFIGPRGERLNRELSISALAQKYT